MRRAQGARPRLSKRAAHIPPSPTLACALSRVCTRAPAQVALKGLQVWEAVIQNNSEAVKPFIPNLLPFVVRARRRR
jgi:hypothetical protein